MIDFQTSDIVPTIYRILSHHATVIKNEIEFNTFRRFKMAVNYFYHGLNSY